MRDCMTDSVGKGILRAAALGLAIGGVLSASSALAQGPGGGSRPGFGEHQPPFERALGGQGDHGRWWNNPKMVEKLTLTDDQRKSMDSTFLAHRETLVDLRGSLEKSELELEPLMGQDTPNETQILAQIDKVAQARAELEKANARFLLEIRGKLSPDQWKQLQADRAAHALEHGAWAHGAWRQGGQGPGGQGPGAQFRHPLAPPPPGAPAPPQN